MRFLVGIAALLLASVAFAAPAEALERGIVYSKTVEVEAAPGEEEPGLAGGLYALRGKHPRRLTYDRFDIEPDVARDGTIAFVRNGDVYLVRPDGSSLRQLTAGPEIDERPLFSPDGRSLAFTRRAVEKGPRDLYAIGLEGGLPQPLAVSPEDDREAAFSLDGKAIVFARAVPLANGFEADLFSVRLDGTGLRQLTRTPEQEWSPHYFLGGILFNRRRAPGEGTSDVYSMRRDGTRTRLAVRKRAGANIDVVSPQGRLLVFRSRGQIWTKRLTAGRSFPARKVGGPPGGISELALSPDNRKVAFLFYFDEALAICTIDLRSGEFDTVGENYNLGGEGGVATPLAW